MEPTTFTLKVCPDCGCYKPPGTVHASQHDCTERCGMWVTVEAVPRIELDTQRSLTKLADLRARGLEGVIDLLADADGLTESGREVVRLALGK